MIVGIILASGYSKRMKRDKLLLEVKNKKAVENVIIASKNSMLYKTILVYRKDQIKIIGDQYGVETIKNSNFAVVKQPMNLENSTLFDK